MLPTTGGGVLSAVASPWSGEEGGSARFIEPPFSNPNIALRRDLAGFGNFPLNESVKVSFKHNRLFRRQLDALKFA